MISYSRIPALLIALITAVCGWWVVTRGVSAANAGDGPALSDLQILIAQPDAGRDVWLQYAQRLQQLGHFTDSAKAYQRVLKFDPYDRPVKLQCAAVLARANDADALEAFMKQVIGLDPKLAVDIFSRPEMQPFLNQPRFADLSHEAKTQSMD